jgi:hypothetical protein
MGKEGWMVLGRACRDPGGVTRTAGLPWRLAGANMAAVKCENSPKESTS